MIKIDEPIVKFGMVQGPYKAGVGNSFVSAGHMSDKLGIQGPVHLLLD